MTEQLFIRILNMSLTGSFVILAVLAVRILLRKAPSIFSYCLWAAVLFRLLCPVSFSAVFSPLSLLQAPQVERGRIEYIPEDITQSNLSQEHSASPEGSNITVVLIPDKESAAAGIQAMSKSELALKAGTGVWLSGICIMILYSIVTLTQLINKLKTATRERDNIYITDRISTPFVIGVIHPRIYLPSILGSDEREYILLHEQIHLKRKDHIVKIIAFCALCLHWFNPLVWVAFFLSGKDMEMSCDEAVIRKTGSGVKKKYSASLLSMSTGKRIVNGVPLAFGEGDTGGRIKNVLRYRKPAVLAVSITAVICVVTTLVLLANPKETENDAEANLPSADYDSATDVGLNTATDVGPESLAELKSDAEVQAMEEKLRAALESLIQEQEELQQSHQSEPTVLTEGKMTGEGIYRVGVKSVSRSAGLIDVYVSGYESPYNGEEPLAFAENCIFKVNYSMSGLDYKEVSFDTFADLIGAGSQGLNSPCLLTFENNLIIEADLESAWVNYGISFDRFVPQNYTYEFLSEQEGANAFETYFSPASTEIMDIADCEGSEIIEVYTGNAGDGDSGIVLFKDAEGKLLCTQDAHTSRAGWNNIYLGETEDGAFIMNVYAEDRWDYGGYGYWVYRLGEDGGIRQIAGSRFDFNLGSDSLQYDDDLFREWVNGMTSWLENCHLILSTQEGEVRTEKISEADKYNYNTLSLKDRQF